ncbi:MAG: transporter substrate-binding domain-containing protein [Pseudomonadota bacterium]
MAAPLESIAQNGVLRVAINTGNKALVQQVDGQLLGVSPALAQRLAEEIGVRMQFVVYPGAGKVFGDATANVWDVGFLATDPIRAEKIAFTRPYVTIEATYAVRTDSGFSHVADVDRLGTEVLTSSGSAYDMHLTKALVHAELLRSGTPPESFEEFRSGRGDAVAGVRASLEMAFAGISGIRILPGALTKVDQAMALPGKENPALAALDAFVARAINEGFVAEALG